MSTNYSDRLHSLFQLEFFGMKLGLENITHSLEFLGRPDRKFPSIHVAGTNGKGSVSAMLAAVHQAAGKRTGLYTSPHLVDFRERIRIDGEMVSEEEVSNFLERVWPKVEELKATFFEVTTAMAFDYFAARHVDIAVIETGLGGRLDATNVLEKPLATVITSIGIDHTQQLGSTLAEIAFEKAGIMKAGAQAIVNCPASVEELFARRGEDVGSSLRFVRGQGTEGTFKDLTAPFRGEHQKENLKTVLLTLGVLPQQPSIEAIERGLRDTARLTGLCGRLEEFFAPHFTDWGIRLFLDVGHNPDALSAVKSFFEGEGIRPIAVFGIMRDKDIPSALTILDSFSSQLVGVHADTPRAMPSAELADLASKQRIKMLDGGSIMNGMSLAMKQSRAGDVILLNGSHYVVGEFLKNFPGNTEVMKTT